MQAWNAAMIPMLLTILALQASATERSNRGPDDDTLKHYLSKADVVVVGEVTDGWQRIGIHTDLPYAVRATGFEFAVSAWIKGKVAAKQTIRVTVTRAHDIEHGHWTPAQGEKLVLFLRPSGDSWVSADQWFGAQPYSQALVEHLKRVQAQTETIARRPPGESRRIRCCRRLRRH